MPEQKKQSKLREYSIVAAVTVGIIVFLFVFVYLPIKLIPKVFSNLSSSSVATTLSSTIIDNNKNSSTSSNQNASGTSAKNYSVQNYYGKPDLAITLISTGIIDRASGQFVEMSSAGYNDEIAMKFEVRNIGTNVSGPWTLRLNMPSRTTPYYDSNQPSIRPGDGIAYTASFNSPSNQGVNTGYIIVDPFNALNENSRNNNNLTVSFNVNGNAQYGYNNGYNNGYNYTNSYNYNYSNSGSYTTYPSNYYGTLYTWSSLSGNCYGSPQAARTGSLITWFVTASGGNGYITYYWTGTDNLYSISNAVNQVYYYPGTKTATVAITSGGQTIIRTCSVNIF